MYKRQDLPQLSYRALYKNLIYLLGTIFVIIDLALLADFISDPYFSDGADNLLKHPQDYEKVAFIHWGTYIGCLIGTIFTTFLVRLDRKKLQTITK